MTTSLICCDSSVPRLELTPAEIWSHFRAAVNCTGLSVAHKKGDEIRIQLFSGALVMANFLITISLLLSGMQGDTESLHQFIVIQRIFHCWASSSSWLRQVWDKKGLQHKKKTWLIKLKSYSCEILTFSLTC